MVARDDLCLEVTFKPIAQRSKGDNLGKFWWKIVPSRGNWRGSEEHTSGEVICDQHRNKGNG